MTSWIKESSSCPSTPPSVFCEVILHTRDQCNLHYDKSKAAAESQSVKTQYQGTYSGSIRWCTETIKNNQLTSSNIKKNEHRKAGKLPWPPNTTPLLHHTSHAFRHLASPSLTTAGLYNTPSRRVWSWAALRVVSGGYGGDDRGASTLERERFPSTYDDWTKLETR